MKLLIPLAGYTLYDHKTNNSIRKELRITSILDKIDEYRKKWLLHLQRMPQNRIPLKSYNYRPQGRNQLDDLKNVGESNYNPGDRTDQRVQSLVFMMMTSTPPLELHGLFQCESELEVATFTHQSHEHFLCLGAFPSKRACTRRLL